MMEISDLVENIKKVFDYLNLYLFENSLKQVYIVFSYEQKKPIKFLYEMNTITIGKSILQLEKMHFLNLFIHEMIHVSNFQSNIKDVGLNEYHNQKFLILALNIGLYVTKNKNQGWSITSFKEIDGYDIRKPSQKKKEYLFSVLESCAIEFFGLYNLPSCQKKKKSRKYLLKYVCQCVGPHNSIRSGRKNLDVFCNVCGSQFILI